MGKKVLIYLLVAVVVITSAALVWHFFKDQVLMAFGWFAIFAIVFFAGWILGRYGYCPKPQVIECPKQQVVSSDNE